MSLVKIFEKNEAGNIANFQESFFKNIGLFSDNI